MNTANRTEAREPQDGANRRTPNSDMQPEDAGTPESGAGEQAGRAAATEPAMKQTDKTEHESGSRR